MRRADLRSLLESRDLIVLDGAMGTELDKLGVPGRCTGNLTDPDSVLEVHRRYIDAGSTAIMTNTLTMNRIFIESQNLTIDVDFNPMATGTYSFYITALPA